MEDILSSQDSRMHYAWWILAASCAFILAVLGIINSCQGIFLVPVTRELGISSSQFSLMITLQGLMGLLSMPIAGIIIPKLNIRIILGVASLFYFGSFTMLSSIHSYSQMLLLGGTQGLAGGFLLYIPVAVMIGNWFQEKQGFAMGLAFAFTGIGGAIFNPVGSALIVNLGWRNGYLLLGLLAALIAFPAILIFRFSPAEKGFFPYGSKGKSEAIQAESIKHPDGFRSVYFKLIIVWAIAIGALGGVMYHIPAFVSQLKHPAALGGTVMSIFMVSMTIGKIGLGFLNDRFGTLKTIIFFNLLAISGISCFLLAGHNVLFLLIGAFLFGPGMALMLVETPILVRKIFGGSQYSAIYSIISMLMNVTATVSVFIYGVVFDHTQSYFPSFTGILLCPILAGFIAILVLKSKKGRQ